MTRPVVEVLTFAGCPNAERALELVARVADELGVEPDVRRVEIADPAAAHDQRFLGSPTIRVDGRDVEPGADARSEYVLACRVYRTDAGARGIPDERWLRDAFVR